MSDKNIVLIGMSGVGKTTVGKLLAEKLGFEYADTDELIVTSQHMEIKQIFDTKGEQYFRMIETHIVRDIAKTKNTIISTGGGVVINPLNVDNLKENGFIILLDASPDFIFNNIKDDTTRPLLKDKDTARSKIAAMMEERRDYYNCYDFKVLVEGLKPMEAVDKIIEYIKGNDKNECKIRTIREF